MMRKVEAQKYTESSLDTLLREFDLLPYQVEKATMPKKKLRRIATKEK